MKVIIARCANPECDYPIYKGDQVWKCGKKLFCHVVCLAEHLAKGKLVRS